MSNKVQTRDGRWQALDGRVLHKAAVAASGRYDTRLEAHLFTRLGVRFTDRLGPKPGRRTVREIAGVDERLLAAWSSRRRDIDARRAVLAGDFPARPRPAAHGGGGDRAGAAGDVGDPRPQAPTALPR